MGAPTILQHKSGFASAATTVTVTFSSAVTAGNMIVVFIGTSVTSNTINTPTMTGETFTKVTGASNGGSSGQGQVATYATNSAVGGHTSVVATQTAAVDIHLHILEISGQIANPQDATGNTNSTTLSVSTSLATTHANDLVLAFWEDDAANHTITAGSGYAQVEQTNNTSGGDVAFSESKTVSATGIQTATITDGGSGNNYAMGIIAIAGTASGASLYAVMPVFFRG